MSEADPALIGRKIDGKYVIEKFLGGGAMGAVYKAKEPLLDRHVAIKVMHGSVAVDPQFVARFHREAKAASRFDHPNSIRIVSFGEEPGGLLYIVMEYVEGRDLYRVIHEDYPLPNEKIADMMMQALGALAVAHEKGLIHRDLKPENLMIVDARDDDDPTKARYQVKVCDFGIAKLTDKDPEPAGPAGTGQKLTTTGLVVGTPEYMSPEQARGERLDARSDIYSMGIILYQLLIGRTPFTGETALAVVLKHLSEVPQPPHEVWDGVHRGLEAVCLKAMQKSANDRFQTARDMRAAVKAAIEGRPVPIDQGTAPTMELVQNAPTIAGTVGGATSGMAPSPVAGTTPGMAPTTQAPTPSHAPVATAPTVVGMAAGTSQVTPLGTEAVAQAPQRGSPVLAIAVAFLGLAVVGLGGYVFVMRPQMMARVDKPAVATTASTPSTNVPSTAAPTNDPAPTASGPEPHASTKPSVTVAAKKDPHGKPTRGGTEKETPTTAKEPEPAPTTEKPTVKEPDPPVATAAPPPVNVTPPPPPTAAPFNPASCRAAVGGAKATSASNVRNFNPGGMPGAIAACAKSMPSRPAGPLAVSVRVTFNDKRSWTGGSCAACPGPVAACVSNATRSSSVVFKDGDAIDSSFEVPVTFTCD